ncbi:LysR family transcriptional regulator [Ferrimonas senticii]|uniref:LysR family transcriptional regulator n=1 Tax=Ferrimonas senticii TaxID=394566 RepID=UPI000412A938|nr:LysR family transcriptional regulator [Ferrimonas senticii]
MTDAKLLQAFVDVVEQGSFAAAAQLRDTDASHLTRQIKRLETGLNVRLLHRSTRALSLTEQGRQIYAKAQQIGDLLADVQAIANTSTSEPSGRLKVTSGLYLGRKFLLPAVETLCQRFPEVTVDVHLADEQVDLIKDRYDLALRVWQAKDTDLVAKHLLDIRFMLVATPEFVGRYGLPQTLAQLQPLPAVAYHRRGHHNKNVNYRTDSGELASFALNANLSINDDCEVERIMMAGSHYCLATNYMVADRVSRGELVQLLPELQLPLQATVSFVYPNRGLSAAANWLIAAVNQQLQNY